MWSSTEENENNDTLSYTEIKMEESDSDISEDTTNQTTANPIPEKSKKKYETEYARFKEWCDKKGIKKITEDELLEFLSEKSNIWKSSTLWAEYSMIKAVLHSKEENCVKNYTKVTDFLKKISKGYKATKSEIFTKEHITRFLEEAPDEKYLMMKVILIFGVTGGCNVADLTYMSLDNIEDTGSSLIVNMSGPNNEQDRSFVVNGKNNSLMLDIYRKYLALRPPHTKHRRLFVNYRYGKCSVQVVGNNTIGKIPSEIAKFLKLKKAEQYTGYCFRRSSTQLRAHSSVNILSSEQRNDLASIVEDDVEIKEENCNVFCNEDFKDISIRVNENKIVESIRIEDSNSGDSGTEAENIKKSENYNTFPKELMDLPFSFNNCTNCNFHIYITHKS